MEEAFSVLIPDGESVYALLALHCFAGFPRVRVHVLSKEHWSPARLSHYHSGYTFKETSADDGSLLEAVVNIVKKEKIDVLLPVDTSGISFAIANHDALSAFAKITPLPDRRSFEVANNKWLTAQFLEENGVSGPPTVLVTNEDSFEKKLLNFEFPVLLKPVAAGGGRGIQRFESLYALRAYMRHQRLEKLAGKFVVQSLITGYDLDLNILSYKGQLLAASIQKGVIPGERKYSPARAIKFVVEPEFFMVAEKLMSAFSWSGFVHVDTICDNYDVLRVVDMNARFWGSLRGSLEAGISFPYLACLAGLGISFPLPTYKPLRYFRPKTTLREGLLGLLGKSGERSISFSESGFRFLLSDPLAEVMRIYSQSSYEPAPVMQYPI